MKYVNFKALDAVTSSANHNSAAIDSTQLFKISAQIIAGTGSVTGTVKFQVSNDPIVDGYQMLPAPTNWTDLGSATTLAGAGTYLITQQDICYRSIRVVFTSAGADTSLITVNLMALAF